MKSFFLNAFTLVLGPQGFFAGDIFQNAKATGARGELLRVEWAAGYLAGTTASSGGLSEEEKSPPEPLEDPSVTDESSEAEKESLSGLQLVNGKLC